mmetsp:Transcript_28545/g.37354  ORF Transcript_28545/g.37354 Transcript_28545/m.37354 type:complete len:169 (+) Transcript_28545:76-582(+)
MAHFIIPAAPVSEESTVIYAPVSAVWDRVRNLTQMEWWNLVSSSTALGESGDPSTVGSSFEISFNDGHKWTVRLVELSDINHSLMFEVTSSEPAAACTSMIHTISLKSVTQTNGTFMCWRTDFSNDTTQEILQDSKFKKLEAFVALGSSFESHHSLADALKGIEFSLH